MRCPRCVCQYRAADSPCIRHDRVGISADMVPEYNCVPGMYAENGLGARVDGAEKLNFGIADTYNTRKVDRT